MGKSVCLSDFSVFHPATFCDRRLFSACHKLFERIVSAGHLIVKNLAHARAEQVQFERFLWNPRIQVQTMLESAQQHVADRADGVEHVLAIQDSSELKFHHRKNEIRGLGVVKCEAVGLFVHPVIAVDTSDNFVLGLCSCQFWSWKANRVQPTKHDIGRQTIENKESFRWIQSACEAKHVLKRAKLTTFVSDRESDLYPLFFRVPDEKTHVLVRSKTDRKVATGKGSNETQKLSEYLSSLPFAGERKVAIRERSVVKNQDKLSVGQMFKKSGNGRAKRIALLKIKYTEVTIFRSKAQGLAEYPPECRLTCIEVVEDTLGQQNQKEERIHWRLLTTHQCHSEEKAWEIVDWYRKRWHIEQLFRVAKKADTLLKKLTVSNQNVSKS